MGIAEMEYNLTDFWAIFDMVHTEHYDPVMAELEVAQFQKESSCGRSVFPEEVWIKILAQVTAPEDLLSLSNSSTYFRHIIPEKSVTFLFHKVIEALAPQYEQKEASNCYREDAVPIPPLDPDYFDYYPDEDPEYYFTSEDDDVYLEPDSVFEDGRWHHFSGRESSRCRLRKTVKIPHQMTGIMKCRLVCTAWNMGIENYYQNPTKRNNYKSGSRNWDVQQFNCGNKRSAPRRFTDHFEDSHNQPIERKNPFLGRSVEICGFAPQQVERGFMNNLNRVLMMFGDEIWFCTIEIPVGDAIDQGTCTQLYSRLKGWLDLLPYLKRLVIKSDSADTEHHPILEDMRRLVAEIGTNPMPTLEYLEFLDVDGILAQIANELIRANNHVSGLRLKRRRWRQEELGSSFNSKYYDELGYELLGDFNGLRELEIVSYSEELLKQLETDKGLASYLETFQVRCFTGSPLDWERVLKMAGNKWGSSLKELALKIGTRLWDNEERRTFLKFGDGCEMKLEKLERLTVYLYQPTKLDFLLTVKKTLEKICFVAKYKIGKDYKENEVKQIIEFYGFEDSMEKSNIWDIFENLKRVEVKDDGRSYRSQTTAFRRAQK